MHHKFYSHISFLLFFAFLFVPDFLVAEKFDVKAENARDIYNRLEIIQVNPRSAVETSAFDFVMTISNQDDMDNLGVKLEKALADGKKCVRVDLPKGRFFFQSLSVQLNGKKYPDVSVHLIGNGTVLMPKSASAGPNKAFPVSFSVLASTFTENGQDLSPWSKALQTDKRIEVVDQKTKKCRIHYKNIKDLDSLACKSSFIQITESYTSERFKIDYIKGGYIYFTPSSLSKNGKDCLNLDLNYLKKYTRFRLCNVPGFHGDLYVDAKGELKTKDNVAILVGTANRFVSLRNSTFGAFEISGVDFEGGHGGNPLLNFQNLKAQEGVFIHDCRFHGVRGTVINGIGSENLFIYNNEFVGCYKDCVDTDKDCSHIQVHHNRFCDCGKDWGNSKCVICHGADYYVAYNDFLNFGYSAIGVGCWQGQEMTNASYGVVEWNTLEYDKEYAAHPFENLMCDSGAIYTWTQNQECIIRYNTITGYTGRKYNHGIYCDDGSFNVKIYGNVITNIPNGYCVGLRYVKLNEKTIERFGKTNEGNYLAYNVFQGSYQFAGTPVKKANGCVKGANMIVGKSLMSGNLVTNIPNRATDVQLPASHVDENGHVLMSENELAQTLRNIPRLEQLSDFVYGK